MDENLYKAFGITVSFIFGDDPAIHIKDSHLVRSESSMEIALRYIHRMAEYEELRQAGYSGDFKSELRKWKAYNFLYPISLFNKKTDSVTFNQNEPRWLKVIYALLSMF